MHHVGDKVYYWYMDETMRLPLLLLGTIVGAKITDTKRGYIYEVSPYKMSYEECQRFGDELYKTIDEVKTDVVNLIPEER